MGGLSLQTQGQFAIKKTIKFRYKFIVFMKVKGRGELKLELKGSLLECYLSFLSILGKTPSVACAEGWGDRGARPPLSSVTEGDLRSRGRGKKTWSKCLWKESATLTIWKRQNLPPQNRIPWPFKMLNPWSFQGLCQLDPTCLGFAASHS